MSRRADVTSALRTVRSWRGPLAWFAAAMAVLTVVSGIGYVVDDRTLVGVPIWAKPLKFSISFAVYAVTLAWMLAQVRGRRLRITGWWAGTVLAAAAVFEMSAIVTQVVRGRQSHFNNATPLDRTIFAVMGALVGVIYVATLVVAVVLVSSPLRDRASAWAVRLGLPIAVAGLSVGFLMLRPTAAQSAQGDDATVVGAHSVGVADGGPGIPLLGWSTTGGDLRVAHFLGMHGLQVLPLVAIALTVIPPARRLTERTRVRIVVLAALGYAGLVALTLWQALRGQALTAPDTTTVSTLAALVIGVGVAAAVVVRADHQSATAGRARA